MNQDILNLYKKAQKGGLNAQEVFWLEGQAAAHPCFGMAYMILARHHYRNQSTIKNKALLKAAAYANNRSLLRHYLEDTLIQPKSRPIPVSEMKPILEKKEAESTASTGPDLKKQETPAQPPVEKPEVQLEASAPVVESAISENSEVGTVDAEIHQPETEALLTEAEPTEQAPAADIAQSDAEIEATAESIVESSAQEPTPETVADAPATEIETVPATEAVIQPTPPQVNWFLNMRVKLRADKYKSLGNRLRVSVANHVPALVPTASAEPAEAIAAPIEAAAEPIAEVQIPENSVQSEISAETVVAEPILDTSVNETTVETNSQSSQIESIDSKIDSNTELSTKIDEVEKTSHLLDSSTTIVNVADPETKVKKTVPDKEYEIGAFSSFTFLSDGESDDSEEVIEAELATLDAVEFQRSDLFGGSGEIIFEENDRIIEISVSPEALNKYFKGRLPGEQPISFGEFTIEFDTFELRTAEPRTSGHPKEVAVEANAGAEQEQPRKKVDDILEKFIENEPSITRGKAAASPSGDLAKNSCHIDDEWVTETLARIYEKQGNRNKAVKIYDKLRLRFPEKNGYFADLIEKLKQ
ncbi:MAG TPA: hypothetical protein VHS96_12190 [Bacteroidia bacterium]|nr:hypothetical protein [Bacteroidia bacterium]